MDVKHISNAGEKLIKGELIMINYVKGDATQPIGEGNKAIIHICNDLGAWGAGFVVALSNKWYSTREAYMAMTDRSLGKVQMVPVEKDITVMNMIAQKGLRNKYNPTPIRYDALETCLSKIFIKLSSDTSIHMPRIGCGLAGGSWNRIEKIIENTMKLNPEIKVYVYNFEG